MKTKKEIYYKHWSERDQQSHYGTSDAIEDAMEEYAKLYHEEQIEKSKRSGIVSRLELLHEKCEDDWGHANTAMGKEAHASPMYLHYQLYCHRNMWFMKELKKIINDAAKSCHAPPDDYCSPEEINPCCETCRYYF